MKKLFILSVCTIFCATIAAQGELKEYNRSSLATMMIYHPEDEFCKDIAMVFDTMPTPDKYNAHNVEGIRFIDFNTFYGLKAKNETYAWRSQDASQLEQNKALHKTLIEGGHMLQSREYDKVLLAYYCKQLKLDENSTWDEVNTALYNTSAKQKAKINAKMPAMGLNKAKYGEAITKKEVEINAKALEEILNENNYAKHMVAKWFNLTGDTPEEAVFNMELVADRGNYNATEMDVNLANQSARGLAMLADAGEELIHNTYVIVNDITYVTSEEKAQVAKVTTGTILAVLGALAGVDTRTVTNTIETVSKIADSFTGFNVKTHSYLFRLVWNDEVANTFYTQHYTDVPNVEKINAFLADNTTYRLEYVAHEYEFDDKTTLKGVDRNAYIRYVCTRSMDKNIAALQLAYEDFKVKTPVFEVVKDGAKTSYAAKIGLKEGITEKSSFQVIRREIDPQTNRAKYRYVATVKPIKGKIWDNRYRMADQKPESDVTATYFRKVAGGEILPGMLLVEGKYIKGSEADVPAEADAE